MIKAILATDDKYGIAKDGKIPWHVKEDFAFFKTTTVGDGNNAVVMGRKTMESLPNKFLSGRKNIIISKTLIEGITIDCIKNLPIIYPELKDVFIIGGAEVYNECFKLCIPEEIIISRIPGDLGCDKFIDINNIEQNYKILKTIKKSSFNIEYWIIK